jgi:hypothetical protein
MGQQMCMCRLLGGVDRPGAESRRLAFLSNLSLRLEDIDHRRTGLRHCNPLAHPHSRAEWSESDRPHLAQVLVPPYLIVKVLIAPVQFRD